MIHIIVLAAGHGTRMGSLSEDAPKFLLKVGNDTLLYNLISKAEKAGSVFDIPISVSVVIGTKGTCWNQDSYSLYNSIISSFNLKIRTVYNFDNSCTQNSFSLL